MLKLIGTLTIKFTGITFWTIQNLQPAIHVGIQQFLFSNRTVPFFQNCCTNQIKYIAIYSILSSLHWVPPPPLISWQYLLVF